MRVAHIGKFYPPTPGGIERVLESLAIETVQAGADVAVLAHRAPGERRTRERREHGVRIIECGCWGQWLYAPISPDFPFALSRLLRDFKPDLLHLHLPSTSAFALLASPAARRLPWVIHWHADIPLDSGSLGLRLAYPLYRPWEQALLRRAAAVIATSPQYVQSSHALARWHDKTTVVPLSMPAMRAPEFDAAPSLWRGDGLRLLAVGRLSHYKGFDVLLRAVARSPDVSLVLIGSGEESARLAALVRELALTQRVHLAGHVDDDALDVAYASAQAFCLPSLDRAEAFGMVLLEAMRAALPVIVSDVPGSGMGYVTVNDETALRVPPNDMAALVDALNRMARDPALRASLGTAGQQRWREYFTPAQTTPALLDLYRRVLGSG